MFDMAIENLKENGFNLYKAKNLPELKDHGYL